MYFTLIIYFKNKSNIKNEKKYFTETYLLKKNNNIR